MENRRGVITLQRMITSTRLEAMHDIKCFVKECPYEPCYNIGQIENGTALLFTCNQHKHVCADMYPEEYADFLI